MDANGSKASRWIEATEYDVAHAALFLASDEKRNRSYRHEIIVTVGLTDLAQWDGSEFSITILIKQYSLTTCHELSIA